MGAGERREAPFRLYNALGFKGQPDLGSYGLLPAKGEGRFWAPGVSRELVDEETVRQRMEATRGYDGVFYVDIEDWKVYDVPDATLQASLAKLGRVADIVRETAPTLQFGFYGIMPENVYWPLVAGKPEQFQKWRECARRAEGLAAKVDFIMPSLYTFYDSPHDRADWARWARMTLTEARRYGKPVYPFLWPQFHESDPKVAGKPVPGDYWQMELETAHALADGIVLWGGWSNGRQTAWDEQTDWWQVTKRFVVSLA